MVNDDLELKNIIDISMKTIKVTLQNQVNNFKKWWRECYSQEEIDALRTDDPGYPDWDTIHDFYEKLLKEDLIKNLDKEDQTNLLWLIARNWDIGCMIAWLSENYPLSHCGNLKVDDFMMLAETLTEIDNPEFNDAKSQFVITFKKFNSLTPEIERILFKLLYFY